MELKFPLYGVIYNWKGLKEENSVYTEEQMRLYEPNVVVYKDVIYDDDDRYSCYDAGFAPNKTYQIYKINNEEQLRAFLSGELNDDISYYEDSEGGPDENGEYGDWRDGWYWENVAENLWTGHENQTMQYILENFKF